VPQQVGLREQPESVLAAVQEPVSSTDNYIDKMQTLSAQALEDPDGTKRRTVTITANGCRVE
jgi:hypothetical protein